jgi:hypothetical protein
MGTTLMLTGNFVGPNAGESRLSVGKSLANE